ncbi:MAG: hypothetical protein AB7F89_17585 [Pirellulaceae bacterium]
MTSNEMAWRQAGGGKYSTFFGWRMSVWTAGLALCVASGQVPAQAAEQSGSATLRESAGSNEGRAAANEPVRPKPKSASKGMVITPEREAAALTFVRQHHAELAELLISLKESSPREYERAIRDLFRSSERLAQIQERDRQAYELELAVWKARSRAELLSARLQMQDDELVREALRTALAEEYDLRIRVLEHEQRKLHERAAALDEQLRQLAERREQVIASRFAATTRAARAADGELSGKGKKTGKKKIRDTEKDES